METVRVDEVLTIDSFRGAGSAPARLTNGFLAVSTTDFVAVFGVQPIHSSGDPSTSRMDLRTVILSSDGTPAASGIRHSGQRCGAPT